MKIRKSLFTDNKASWWYWFEKLDDNHAKCKNCEWMKNRGPAKSTSILKSHLKSRHYDLYKERMEAEALTPTVPKRKNISGKGGGRQRGKDGKELGANEDSVLADGETALNDLSSEGSEIHNDIWKASPSKAKATTSQETMIPTKEENMDLHMNEAFNNNLNLSAQMLSLFMNTLDASSNTEHQPNTRRSSGMPVKTCSKKPIDQASAHHVNGNIMKSAKADPNLEFLDAGGRPLVKMSRVESFSAAHRLHNGNLTAHLNREIYGKCNNGNGHGHNYTWKVVLEGPIDSMTGMVYNLADLKREMAEIIEEVDHKNLDLDVPYFRSNGVVSTTENLAVFLYDRLSTKMTNPGLLKKVVIRETDKNSFSYSGQSL